MPLTRSPILAAALCAATALAAPNPDPGGDGGGVMAYISDMSLADAGVRLGQEPPPGTKAILEEGDGPRFTDVPIDQLDRENGGDGQAVYDLFPE